MQKLDSFQIHVDDGKPKKHKPRYFETQKEEIYTIDAKKIKKWKKEHLWKKQSVEKKGNWQRKRKKDNNEPVNRFRKVCN
jgi:hypothetical protein